MNDTVIEIIKSLEGRNELWQWDTGRQIKITPGENAIVDEIHFSNAYSKDALVVKPQVNAQGNIVADIPNILLWQVFPINVYVVMDFPNGKGTIYEEQLKINPRKKPSDYVYTETEILNYLDLEKRIKALEENGTGGITEETDPTVSEWAKEPTKPSYTADEVGAIPTPNTARVGQIIAVKAVDDNGKPTEFEAVDRNVVNTSILLKDTETEKTYKLEVINGKLTMTEVE